MMFKIKFHENANFANNLKKIISILKLQKFKFLLVLKYVNINNSLRNYIF